ncbi:Cell division cycle-associated protein 3 [Acipenser ruthenus]|uniref:Cell division cycle-associated protein 3 n=1 Tax=Acipenser ruthenus TaxID=7906 RepID=A0A662YPK9_ACIRT|nr:Cell division cycle-associated protein 3 [Acipenser ruthenus]
MGSAESKVLADTPPSALRNKHLASVEDPRSPSTGIARTPIQVHTHGHHQDAYTGYAPLARADESEPEDGSLVLVNQFQVKGYRMGSAESKVLADTPPSALRNKHLASVEDPRSPSTGIARTPIQEPFDPRSPSVGITRTPVKALMAETMTLLVRQLSELFVSEGGELEAGNQGLEGGTQGTGIEEPPPALSPLGSDEDTLLLTVEEAESESPLTGVTPLLDPTPLLSPEEQPSEAGALIGPDKAKHSGSHVMGRLGQARVAVARSPRGKVRGFRQTRPRRSKASLLSSSEEGSRSPLQILQHPDWNSPCSPQPSQVTLPLHPPPQHSQVTLPTAQPDNPPLTPSPAAQPGNPPLTPSPQSTARQPSPYTLPRSTASLSLPVCFQMKKGLSLLDQDGSVLKPALSRGLHRDKENMESWGS